MRYPRMKIASILICALAMAACGQQEASAPPSGKSEILWDKWGVPHIYGETADAASYAYGWAQMKGHADILLELFGTSRGRAAEYWGEQHAESDIYLHKLGVPERAAALYQAQGAEYQARLDAFVAGMNDYAAQNPEEIARDKR